MTRDFVIGRFRNQAAGRRGSLGNVEATLALVRGDHSLNRDPVPPAVTLRPASVLVPLVDRPAELSVLLTQRTQHLAAHAGQISFPGGSAEPCDSDAVATALREAEEEVGLPASHVEVIGRLDTYVTSTGFEVTPVVAFVRAPFPLRPDPHEVAEVFEVPLAFFLDPTKCERHSREVRGRQRSYFVFPFENHYIWGATAGMLVNLAEVLGGRACASP